jgi:hypothetical protein
MSVRVVIDVSEDDLAEIAQDKLLALAFVNAVCGIKNKAKLTNGTTISTITDVGVSGAIGYSAAQSQEYDFKFGYGRYREDQASVAITGENGSHGQLPVRKPTSLAPIK